MSETQKFLFDTDFKVESTRKKVTQEDIANADAMGFARGYEAGQQAANQMMAAMLSHLGNAAHDLLQQADSHRIDAEKAAISYALAFARKIGGAAIARAPVAPIAEAAQACFEHLTQAPHLVARVHESLTQETQAVLDRLGQEKGFEGRFVIMGEPDMALGDVHLEWADGGLIRDAQAVTEAVTNAVQMWLDTPGTQR